MNARALGLFVVLAAICACEPSPPPSWNAADGYRWRALVVKGGRDGFSTVSERRTGVRFQNTVSDSVLLGNRMLAQGAGVALGDVDGDGLIDVFLARTEGCNALFRNLGAWRFEDITQRAGVGACDRHSSGVALADIDGDVDLDLILLATTGPNSLFVNDGAGRFSDRSADLGFDTTGRGGTTITMADVEGDGDLDLYVANYKPYHVEDTIPPAERAFNRIVRQIAPGRYDVAPQYQRDYKVVDRPDMGGLNLTMRGEPNDFYVNTNGRFTRAAFASRFRAQDGRPLEEPESFALAARFADLNMDGAPDLYVANDFEDTDELWFNDGRGAFRRSHWTALRQVSHSSMGVDVADVDADGLPDLFVVDMLGKDSRRATQIPAHKILPKVPGDIETQLQQQRNTLFRNRGDGTFAEIGQHAGVQASDWSWSTMFVDVDLDGWQDILVANGHLWDIMDGDTYERLGESRTSSADWRRLRWEFPKLAVKNVAFRNRGGFRFDDVSDTWRFGTENDVSHAMAAGDLDGDGDQDVVVNRLGAPALLLRNDAAAGRVAVRLIGRAPNTRAAGAKVLLRSASRPLQQREIAVGGLYLSHSDYQMSLALAESDSATLEVEWRDGQRTVIGGVRANRLYEIQEGGRRKEEGGVSTNPPSPFLPPPSSIFEDATSELRGHTHTDSAFNDWERQLLLPSSLAQLGPGIAWFDYDSDADEDLFVGSGRGGHLGVFRNDAGKLVPMRFGLPAPADFTGVLGLRSASGTRVLLGVSSWEGPSPSSVLSLAATGTTLSAPVAMLGARESSAGPLAAGDYDGDGDVDLFVGGRAIPAQYPRAPSSYLYRNTGTGFELDTAHTPVLKDVGMVSAAMFADIDADGDADLLLAREWNSILLLINEKGTLRPADESWGLTRWTSRWNGLSAGDLDGDGRLDLIATSWGTNTMMPADSARPLVLLHGPIGSGAEEQMLIARDDGRGRLMPLNGFGRVRAALPGLAGRIGSFRAYADATVDSVLGPARHRAARSHVRSLEHVLFLNRGTRFEARALPAEAQFAPAFYSGIADFDGDGFEDVVVSQNFFATAPGLPRYDTGRGLLLKGDGAGGLTAATAQESGLLVHGDQRGAAYADYNRDGRLDLVISQNAAATRLFRNRGAKPGLRVRLRGPTSNPDAIGAQARIVYGDRLGPVREIHAGSGYWSQDGAVQVFGLAATPSAVWVRWPGGRESRTAVPAGAREVVITAVGDGGR